MPEKKQINRPHWKSLYQEAKTRIAELEAEIEQLKLGGVDGTAIIIARSEGFQAGVNSVVASLIKK